MSARLRMRGAVRDTRQGIAQVGPFDGLMHHGGTHAVRRRGEPHVLKGLPGAQPLPRPSPWSTARTDLFGTGAAFRWRLGGSGPDDVMSAAPRPGSRR
ncbi:hypothetical protein ACWD25_45870, partial [Streptomyces sp. NPDC002920]